MNDERYAPPAAVVSDTRSEADAGRPRFVILAIRMRWVSFAIGFVASLGYAFQPVEDLSIEEMLVITAVWWAVTFGLCYWLFTAAWRGKAWSRWVQLGLFVLGILFGIWMAPELDYPTYLVVLDWLATLLDALALGLLFTPSANAWYRAMRAVRPS